MKLSLALLTALAVLPDLAWSQGTPVSSVDCADIKDDAARLKCYDLQAARQRAAAPAVKQSAVAAAAPAPTQTPIAAVAPAVTSSSASTDSSDPKFGLQGQVLRKTQERAAPHKGSDEKKPAALVARVASVSQQPGFNLSLVLDNGQVWEQAEQRSDVLIQPNDPVTIKPGLLGSFYLTDVAHQTIRFRRVR